MQAGEAIYEKEENQKNQVDHCGHQNFTIEQKATIDRVQACGGFEEVAKTIERIKKLRILVIGEPILDIYRFVTPEGISSKSPSISARFQYEEKYHGGSLAIRNHLLSFSDHVNLQSPNQIVPKKIRYISGNQRIFEVTEIEEQSANDHFIDLIMGQIDKTDLIILADFGHGLFEGEMLNICNDLKPFVALNVQTNSSNFGFNPYHKHKRFNYLCLDTREARIAEHDRYSHPLTVAHKVHERIKTMMSMTAGPTGAYFFNGYNTHYSPSFVDNIVDATGAGDAYFAITACLIKAECHPDLVPFVGNIFAGLKTKILGNKTNVSKSSLLKAIKYILA